MTTGQVVIGILGAGIGAGIMGIIQSCLNRKWAKEDKENSKLDAVVTAQKLIMLDRVRYLGKKYITEQEISLEDKETLIDMHKAYKALGGNGHLDAVMEEVERLPIKT